jgi:hypothetical protein
MHFVGLGSFLLWKFTVSATKSLSITSQITNSYLVGSEQHLL